MELLADGLLFAAAVGAAFYCHVLASRLRRLTALDSGMGGAIAVLSAQVDDMTRALRSARAVAAGSEQRLAEVSGRAEVLARRLELMVASMHDLPPPEPPPRPARETAQETAPVAAPEPGPAPAQAGAGRTTRRRVRARPLTEAAA